MTAQQNSEVASVLKAYVFTAMHQERICGTFGAIASSFDEAMAHVQSRYASTAIDYAFFNNAVSRLSPALISWRAECREVKKEGYYAFLGGVFFCKCGGHQVIAQCAKEKSCSGWTAVIYCNNHYVKPLS